MCTVTMIARRNGYALAMNRDEQLTRVAGLPPAARTICGRTVLAPSEPGGGTWIGLHDGGVTMALINWYAIATRVQGKPVSRGNVVNATSAAATPKDAEAALAQLPLKKINPFRLIGVFPATKEILEWRWDLEKLTKCNQPWETQQWISSGLDEPAARRIRSQAFRRALEQKSAGSLPWLRRLHRSHSPEVGPFSTCMHRADAATVSCTVVTVQPNAIVMSHHSGPSCQCRDVSIHKLGGCK